MITKNDLKVIKECLAASGVKNSEFEQLNSVPKDDDAYIALVYKGRNYKIKVSDLKFVSKIICGDEIFVPDELGNLTLNLNNAGTSIIAVKFSGSNFPNASTVLIEEGDYFYHSYSNTLHRWNKGWQVTPMVPGFYYMYNGGRETLYIYIEGIGLKEVAKDKQDKLINGQNIKTINGLSILGAGNLVIETGGEASTSNLEYVVIRDVSMVPRDEVIHSLYTETDGEIVYGKYTRCFLLHSTHDDKMYDSWVQGSFHPSSEAVQGAKFAVWVSPEETFAMYYIDEDGHLKESTPPGTRFAYLSYWVEDRSELGGGHPNDYAICGRELLKLDYDSMWQTIVPDPLEWGWEGINPAQYDRWVFLYEGDLYYYEAGFPPRKMMEGATSVTNTVTTLLSRVTSDEGNITDLQLNITRVKKHVVNPLLVKGIITTDVGPSYSKYTGTLGDLYYMNNNNYKGFVWLYNNVYYTNWDYGNDDFLSKDALSAANVSIIYTIDNNHLYIYKIVQEGLLEIFTTDNITVDTTLNINSDNPVKNRTIANAISELEIGKLDALRSSVNIKTINGTSILGEGNITINTALTIVVSYAGENPQQKEGQWSVGLIYYDTDAERFYVCTRDGYAPDTETTVPNGSILYIEQPDEKFYYYNYLVDGVLVPILKPQLVDDVLSLSSSNPVENRAIAAALNNKQDRLSIEDLVIQNSENVVTSGAVYQAIQQLLPEVSPEMAFTPGDGINIYEEVDDATDTRRVVISLSDAALRKLNYDIPALLQRVELIELKLREKFPDDPVPVVVEFDPTVGNWGAIHLLEDPEKIDVADVMNAYTVTDLADITDENISVWATGDTPPEGPYYITAEKAGLVHYPTGRLDLAYANRKVLCDITSDTGTYANCVGLVLGYDGNPETYYFDFLPGDGSMRSCTVSGTTYTYQTADEGLLMADNKYWDRGIVIKKNFTIKGMTFDTNNLPTSGLLMSATHDGYITGGPFFYTRHSLDLIGVKFTQRSGWNLSTNATSKAACVIVDSVNGIDQVQIKYCQFAVTGDLYQSAHAITLIGRDENPVDPVTSELKETNCIKDLLIYNNTFAGTGCIMGVINGSGYTNIPDNYLYARFLNTCRIVGNNFTSASSYAINLAYLNENREYPLTIAFTLCPIYIVDNTIEGKPGIIDGAEGTQHCSIVIKTGRLFVLHNTIRDYVVRQAGGATTAFAYASGTALYFCNNTCENLAKFSANNTATLILYKTAPVPSTYTNTRYETVRYIYGNTFRLDINTINTWWTNWLNSTSATTTDRSLDFDTCLSIPVLPHTENVVDSITLKNNTFNFRTVYGISPYSTSLAKNFVIENNTFNFGVLKFYNDNSFSGLFTIGDIGGEQLNITIRNNRFVTGLPTVRLLTLMNLSGDPVSITFDGNSVPDNVVLNKQEARSNSTNVTITPIYNNSDSEYVIIPPSGITSEEATIINGIGS